MKLSTYISALRKCERNIERYSGPDGEHDGTDYEPECFDCWLVYKRNRLASKLARRIVEMFEELEGNRDDWMKEYIRRYGLEVKK